MDRADRPARQSPLWLSVISVALIVTAVVAALAATQRLTFGIFGSPARNALSSALSISTENIAGLAQPQSATFSPDGSRVAVIGAFTPCHQWTTGLPRCGHGLAIFDTKSGALIQMSPIEPLLGVTTPDDTPLRSHGSGGYVSLQGMGWSPDSVWYAIEYTVFNTPTPTSPDDMLDSGLVLINPQTGATQVMRGDAGYFSALGEGAPTWPIWHLHSGAQTTGSTTPAGLIFAWGANGAPFPTQAIHGSMDELPANAGARYPVGQPDGSAPFTIWQPGVVIGPGSAGVGGGRSAFITTFATWSADGANVTLLTEGVILPTPVKAVSPVSAPAGTAGPVLNQPVDLPVAPARDLALAKTQESVGAYGWALVAWNPSGSALASVTCFAHQGPSVDLRDTASGAQIGTGALRLGPDDTGCRDASATNLSLAWSADGAMLLALDRSSATLTLWRMAK